MNSPKLDARYTIQREFCGTRGKPWVVRFCGDWVGFSPAKRVATRIAKSHRLAFLKSLEA